MNMKRIFLVCALALVLVFTLAACDIGSISLMHKHTVVVDEAVAATCKNTGLTAGAHCSVCGVVIAKQEVIGKLDHTVVIDEAVKATCAKEGLTQGAHCAECSKIIEAQYKTPTSDHNFENRVCIDCGAVYYSKGLEYFLNSEKANYSVFKIGRCTDVDIVIPSRYNGLPVTYIDNFAFGNCTSLTSVVIPGSITYIGDGAFENCSGLTSVVISDGVRIIASAAFRQCSSLTRVVIPDGVTRIGASAFASCSGLTSIVIPESVISIGSGAFHDCRSLESIRFGGTKAQWNSISEGLTWGSNPRGIVVICSDGTVTLN